MRNQKMLAILSVLLVLSATFGVAVGEEAKKPEDKKLMHLYYVTFHEMEKLRIGMEAVIKYVQETGNDTTKLTELKNSFVAKQGEIKTIAEGGDKSAFKDAIAQIRNITVAERDHRSDLIFAQILNNSPPLAPLAPGVAE